MHHLTRHLLVAGVALLGAAPARAALRFEPVYIYLRAGEPATLLKLTNDSDAQSRYQVGIFSWTQSASGEIQLKPTRDVVFFPTVFSLAPGEQRGIRIGTTLPFEGPEKTFRILIEELPQERPGSAAAGTIQFNVRSRISLPIFVEPPKPIATARIERAQVTAGALNATLRSTGNAHVHLQGVQAVALDGSGAVVHEHKWGGAYLLPGGEWQLSESLPADRCRAVRWMRVDVQTDKGKLTETVEVPKGACTR
jgi:fimbrial chaperone protein